MDHAIESVFPGTIRVTRIASRLIVEVECCLAQLNSYLTSTCEWNSILSIFMHLLCRNSAISSRFPIQRDFKV